MRKIIICLFMIFLIGCAKETTNTPTLKIADCGDRLVVSLNDTLEDSWNSDKYTEWRNSYPMEQFFPLPAQCEPTNVLCSSYSTALIVYENCSVYYLDTKVLYREESK